jgi:hypothetical protein
MKSEIIFEVTDAEEGGVKSREPWAQDGTTSAGPCSTG